MRVTIRFQPNDLPGVRHGESAKAKVRRTVRPGAYDRLPRLWRATPFIERTDAALAPVTAGA